jgi:cell division septum initiation protein DivIVA
MDILRILDELKEVVVERPRYIGPIAWGIDQEEVNIMISKVRASLPQEMKQAVSTVRESQRILEGAKEDAGSTIENARKEAERIVSEAKKDAERIIDQAKIQQERMVSESEILKLSKAQSEEIRNAADRDAVQMRRGAERFSMDVLNQLEGVVGKVMSTIERGKQELERADSNQPVRK